MRVVLKEQPDQARVKWVLQRYNRSRVQLVWECGTLTEKQRLDYLWWRAEWLFRCIEHLKGDWRHDPAVQRAKRELHETCRLRGMKKQNGKTSPIFRLRKLLRQDAATPILSAAHGAPELHP